MALSRTDLLKAAQNFCDAFSQKKDVDTILSYFSTGHKISAIEYGTPTLAPFLGRSFTGISEVKQYFELIGSLLSYKDVEFFEYVVDSEAMKVSVKGKGTFTWQSTGKTWNEVFTYTLDFDNELKVVRYQVWADSGTAYLARIGELHCESGVAKLRDEAGT
ncbi:hypothetical protein M413DRAFT_441026 [Hebeloma cylindrosporum]|uniref:SnoaL-like domain-containing protein n=1 Tax=Hebeloma cylindrosporum TaxID=76867 RepID=A0A0C3CPD0_HEBCY|nr:hypothetical protein M413DRAFT_441026 [Hebeloma cylindrosporum h7]